MIVIVNSLPKEVFPFLFVHMYMYMNAPHSIEVEAGELESGIFATAV